MQQRRVHQTYPAGELQTYPFVRSRMFAPHCAVTGTSASWHRETHQPANQTQPTTKLINRHLNNQLLDFAVVPLATNVGLVAGAAAGSVSGVLVQNIRVTMLVCLISSSLFCWCVRDAPTHRPTSTSDVLAC